CSPPIRRAPHGSLSPAKSGPARPPSSRRRAGSSARAASQAPAKPSSAPRHRSPQAPSRLPENPGPEKTAAQSPRNPPRPVPPSHRPAQLSADPNPALLRTWFLNLPWRVFPVHAGDIHPGDDSAINSARSGTANPQSTLRSPAAPPASPRHAPAPRTPPAPAPPPRPPIRPAAAPPNKPGSYAARRSP